MKKIKTIIQFRKNQELIKKGNLLRRGIFPWFLDTHVFTLLMSLKCSHVFLLKASYSLRQPDCCSDGVVIACAWTWSLFLVFWFYNTNQLTFESTNHFRIIRGRNRVPGLSEYLLGTPSDKIKKVPASEFAEWGR